MASGKKGSNPPKSFICEYCGEPFKRIVYPSSRGEFQFCSPTCRNKARILKDIPCLVCGTMFKPSVIDMDGIRRKHCSQECAWRAQIGKPSPKRTPAHIREAVAKVYPQQGPEPLMEMFNLDRKAIQQIAYKEGVKLSPALYKARVHGAAQQHMLNDNPMKHPEVAAKVAAWRHEHWEEVAERSLKARSANQRLHPSNLEIKLRQCLTSLGVEFEPSAMIKPKFIVDIRIGDLIIQADGDYWHGHPRFEPLTERQETQQRRDKAQGAYLHKCGYTVIRIWESDMSLDLVKSILENHGIV